MYLFVDIRLLIWLSCTEMINVLNSWKQLGHCQKRRYNISLLHSSKQHTEGTGQSNTRTNSIKSLVYIRMKNLRYHFPTCYAYSVKEPIGEVNLKRVLEEDTGVFSSFFSFLSSSSPLGQTAVSGNSTLHQ